MKRPVIANWKMNLTLNDAIEFCNELLSSFLILGSQAAPQDPRVKHEGNNLIIAAPNSYLAYLASHFPQISFVAQDVSGHEQYGSFTGEVSALQLKSSGVKYCIVGHLERRRNFGETDDMVRQKADNCIRAGLVPIICLFEDLTLRPSVDGEFILAYEPASSIGTGVIPDMDSLAHVFEEIKSVAGTQALVYGGSVNSSNLASIKAISDIDGLLVGGASLKLDELMKILEKW